MSSKRPLCAVCGHIQFPWEDYDIYVCQNGHEISGFDLYRQQYGYGGNWTRVDE